MRVLGAIGVGAVLAAGLVWLLLPPVPARVAAAPALGEPVRGAFHVHTRRSDGSGTVADVAFAAARAGLDFVVITDHGDGTMPREPPTYIGGVLIVDAVEIGGEGGHVVALDLPTALYPLGGETRDVVEDVQRLGGMAIAAHPASDRDGLRFTAWDAPVDGLEWINGDSQWRDESLVSLGRTLLTYPVRQVGALTALLDRPEDTMRRWDALARARPVVGLAAGDAHARIGVALNLPAYERVFRTMSIALPEVTFGGLAREDSRAVLAAIRGGRLYSTIDGLASPGLLSFEASTGGAVVGTGGRLPPAVPVTVRVASNAPGGARVVLFGDGDVVAEAEGASLEFVDPDGVARAYRVEIQLSPGTGGPSVPWIVSNPIHVGRDDGPVPEPVAAGTGESLAVLYGDEDVAAWRLEQSPRAKAALDEVPAVGGTQMLVRWGLGGTLSEGPFVAVVREGGAAMTTAGRLRFTGRADRPMRLSVQVRTSDGRRWYRSVYLDSEGRELTVALADMRPADPDVTGPPPSGGLRDVLFVVDTVNTAIGGSGQVWLDEIRLFP